MKTFVVFLVGIFTLFIAIIIINNDHIAIQVDHKLIFPTATTKPKKIIEPVKEFKKRITKKFFGTYITPENSPVQPERFTGFHTGVDVEYQDVTIDVPVYAIADGTVVVSKYATGYGGVMVIKIQIGGKDRFAIYGHLRPSSMKKIGEKVTIGQEIGLLGIGFSQETNGERRHLHFGIANTDSIKGYVSKKSELSNWLDPLTLY